MQKAKLFKVNNINYTIPFIFITSLFLIWGFSHALLDVLNKHFQNIIGISKMESGFIQATVYGGYFIAAIPAGLFMKRFGYKKGIILGLLFVAIGAFMFIPATGIREFWSFLIALFVLACGLACLETAANPYSTLLGPKETAERRINLAQSFNAVGWFLGPLVGSAIILSSEKGSNSEFTSLAIPYTGLGLIVLFVAILFFFIKLPEIKTSNSSTNKAKISIFKNKYFVLAVIAQFFYVAAQTGVNSFFINYVSEAIPSISDKNPGYILAFGGMGMFWLGRISGSYFMSRFQANKLLSLYAFMNVLTMFLVVLNLGWVSVVALFCTYFFMSIMFPTIFAMGIKGFDPEETKQASSFMVMAIVGGALCPPLMGYIADNSSMNISFIIPLICFALILFFGLKKQTVQNQL